MDIISSAEDIFEKSCAARRSGKSIGFVPTMGALHEGHLSLLKKARAENDLLILSIFVNPTQFAPGEDFEKYPRDQEADSKIAKEAGVDLIFAPDASSFADGEITTVSVAGMNKILCGKSRPTHFDGVTTVVTKLLNSTAPDRAYFGEKDYQQLTIIKKMVRDLRIPVEIIGCPIIREPDGLAMSSRNRYMDSDERKRALSLKMGIEKAKEMVISGVRNSKDIEEAVSKILEASNATIDYVSICHPDTLKRVDYIEKSARILLAAKIGNTRLIDNEKLEV